ncbi:MAG: SulP family inorganic anion transporter, partial [Ectothiorhodospiraceae bacterium]|nr:SulP family inorganic anion transporter [Ectothiorhodospiraceae bacterium]
LTEAVSISRAIAIKSGQRIDGNQEFVGQGLSNLIGSFFASYPSSGSFNRSGLNYAAGARTPLASVFAAVALVLILLLVAPLAAYLPIAAMAGILFLVAWGLIDFHHIREILHTSRAESAVLLTTLLATLFVELEFAIYLGVILSLMLYLNRTSRPEMEAVVPDPTADRRKPVAARRQTQECPQLKLITVHGSIFFGAVNHVQGVLYDVDEQEPRCKHVLLLAAGINFVDMAGAQMLAQEAERRRAMGGGLYLCGVKRQVCEMLGKSGLIEAIGEENIFRSKSVAMRSIVPRLNGDICRDCRARIFLECAGMPGAQTSADDASNSRVTVVPVPSSPSIATSQP